MGLAVLSGVPGLLAHGSYLKHIWVEAHLLGLTIKQGTTLLFDLGVFAVVLGGVGTLVVTGVWIKLFPTLAKRDRMHTPPETP